MDVYEFLKSILHTPELIEKRKSDHPYCQECLTGCNKRLWIGSQPERKARDFCIERGPLECFGVYTQFDFDYAYEECRKVGYETTSDDIKGLLCAPYWLSTNVSLKGQDLVPYWYQDRALRCTSKKKVLRMSRRAGKSEMLAMYILHKMFNAPQAYYSMLVICPAKNQAKEIWDKMWNMLDSNPDLMGAIKPRQSPYYELMVLATKNKVRIFTAGSKSGTQAVGIRGQSGNELILDEMDFLAEEDITTITPILTDADGGTFLGASTLKGTESLFYKYCHTTNVKEFYVPFKARPDWTPAKEQDARDTARTELAYDLEYNVIWTGKLDGVFQRTYVTAAFNHKKYQYGRLDYIPDWKYFVGIDWNGDNNGTRIMILGYSPEDNRIYSIDKCVVAYKNWTQTKAINKIVEINRVWKPELIVIDKGFGQFQDEVLRAIGLSAETQMARFGNIGEGAAFDVRLKEIVEVVDFGGTITVPNLYTKQDEQFSAKHFLVENLQRFFEQLAIALAEDDDLKQQLLDYVVDRYSNKGYPVYKGGLYGDHDLDALALACFGFAKKMHPEFQESQPVLSVNISNKSLDGILKDNDKKHHSALEKELSQEEVTSTSIVLPRVDGRGKMGRSIISGPIRRDSFSVDRMFKYSRWF